MYVTRFSLRTTLLSSTRFRARRTKRITITRGGGAQEKKGGVIELFKFQDGGTIK